MCAGNCRSDGRTLQTQTAPSPQLWGSGTGRTGEPVATSSPGGARRHPKPSVAGCQYGGICATSCAALVGPAVFAQLAPYLEGREKAGPVLPHPAVRP